jgi:hypothetical protein
MIAKVCRRGASATGLLRYLTGDTKDGYERLDDASAKRLNAPSAVRPDIAKPMWHAALSLPAGERLEAGKWAEIAGEFIERMGLSGNEWTAIVHNETDHQHAHIVANRVGYDGAVWAGEWEAKRAIEACKALEQAHGLAVDEHIPTGRAALTQPEIEKALRTETQPTRTTLQNILDAALADRSAISTFLERVEGAGVRVIANMASTGKVSGLAYEFNGEQWKGSELGKRYGWGTIATRTGYEQERDSQEIQKRAGNRAGGDKAREPGNVGNAGQLSSGDGAVRGINQRAGGSGEREHGISSTERASVRQVSRESRSDLRTGGRLDASLSVASSGNKRQDRYSTRIDAPANTRSNRNRGGARGRISALCAALLSRSNSAANNSANTGHERSSRRCSAETARSSSKSGERER